MLGDLITKVAAGGGTEADAQVLDDAPIFAQAEARRFRKPQTAGRALNRSALRRNEAGIPTNLGALITELRKAHPGAGQTRSPRRRRSGPRRLP